MRQPTDSAPGPFRPSAARTPCLPFVLACLAAAACDDGASAKQAASDAGGGGAGGSGPSIDCPDCDAGPTPADTGPEIGQVDLATVDGAVETCAPDETRCADQHTAEACGPGGGWLTIPCGEGEVCNNGVCLCLPGTSPGCDGRGGRFVCQADGSVVTEACSEGEVCTDGLCDVSRCASGNDCDGDTYCEGGVCLPYRDPPEEPFAGECRVAPLIGDFTPEVQCRWNAGQVSGQPILIDLDKDGTPSVVFVVAGEFVAVRGDDCQEEMRSAIGHGLSNESSIAAGDIDADGMPDVVGMSTLGAVWAVNHNFELKWLGATNAAGIGLAPAIADLDADGLPEVIAGGTALNGEDGTSHGRAGESPSHAFGPIPAVADIDGDGLQEVLYGNRIFDSQMQDVTPEGMRRLTAGHVAVADFFRDLPGPELAVVHGTTSVRIQAVDGTILFGPYQVPESMWGGGAPNVADFDGDGFPEIGTAGSNNYAVLDPDCAAEPLPEFCQLPGIRWLKPTRDTSSGSTGSTTFDFEGDGKVEVVYNDECFLRVYAGDTGEVRLALANTTGTIMEAPIVADSDGDYNSEIIVGSDTGFPCNEADPDTGAPPAQTQGITILRDVADRWVHSRPIWNQNAYSITNVENDGTIPRVPEANWLNFNNFRQNLQPDDKALEAPDLTVRVDRVEREGCGPAQVVALVHNRGSQPVSRGLVVAFFDGDPLAGGALFCRAETMQRLEPGQGEEVACTWGDPPPEGGTVYVYVDAFIEGLLFEDQNFECAEGNNDTLVEVPGCQD